MLLPLLLLAALSVADPPGLAVRAEAALAERYRQGPHLEVRVLRTGGEIPAGRLRLAFPTGDAVPRGHLQVDVLGGEGEGRRAGWLLLQVAHFDSVLVPTRRLARGGAVPPDALEAVWTETTRLAGDPLRPADLPALGEPVANRFLPAGRPLRHGDLRAPNAAEPGDAVALRYERNGLALVLSCRAREAGAPGATIRVICPDTGALYRALLTAPGEAAWVETLSRR
jgi:flagella basal body P-ring formation protein FlgA